MKYFSFLFATLLITSCTTNTPPTQNSVTITDDLYTTISAETACAMQDNDNAVYQKYKVTTAQMEAFKQEFLKSESHSQKIREELLRKVGECLARG